MEKKPTRVQKSQKNLKRYVKAKRYNRERGEKGRVKKENKKRTLVVDSLSGLSMLESLAYNLRSDIPAHTAVEAISRHYCSLYGDTTLSWYKAKNDVRKIVLQGTQSPNANVLLQSNMWEPTVFSKEAVDKLIASDEPKIGIERRLQLGF